MENKKPMQEYVETEINGRPLWIETGTLAAQAGGAVTVRYGDTVVLVTATASPGPRPLDFFPLTVDYEERLYAAGKIPGSFFRREGRPGTEAILAARLTDRPIRPLFPTGFRNDVQIIITVLSADQENDPDVLGTIGASCALMISPIPFEGPVSSVRVGRIGGKFVAMPTFTELQSSDLDLIVAGTREAIMMVECGSQELPEDVMLEAIRFGDQVNKQIIAIQDELIAKTAKPKMEITPKTVDPGVDQSVRAFLQGKMEAVVDTRVKKNALDAEEQVRAELQERFGETFQMEQVLAVFESVHEAEVRNSIVNEGRRPDGRGMKDIRPISVAVGVLPRTHGTGLFQRGETQVLTIATLGGVGEAQKIDSLSREVTKRYMHHYNFPPFSVGEVRRVGSPPPARSTRPRTPVLRASRRPGSARTA